MEEIIKKPLSREVHKDAVRSLFSKKAIKICVDMVRFVDKNDPLIYQSSPRSRWSD